MEEESFSLSEWVNTPIEPFNEEEYFTEHVQPHIRKAIELCKERRIPIQFKAVVALEEKGANATVACSNYLPNKNLGRVAPVLLLASALKEVNFNTIHHVTELLDACVAKYYTRKS